MVGDQITYLALPWLTLLLTHSPFQLGIVAALDMLPYTFFALPAGVYIDRWDRRAVMLIADVVRFVVLASVPLAAAVHLLGMPHIYAVAFIAGSARVWHEVASYALLPSLVGSSRLIEGNSRLEMSQGLAALVGPSMGGFLIKLFGAANALLADALSFLVSAAALLSIGPRRAATPPEERGWRAQLMAGLRFVFGRRILLESGLTTMALNFFFTAIQAVIVFYMQHELHLDAAQTGALFALAGIGPIAFALLASRISHRIRLGQLIVLSILAMGLLTSFLIIAPQLPRLLGFGLVALSQALVFGLAILFRIAVISYFQAYIPGHLLARVNSSVRLLSRSAIPLGALFGGVVAQAVGVAWLIALVSVFMVLESVILQAVGELKKV
jgi:MFS family permease